jgi:hypothetical protein
MYTIQFLAPFVAGLCFDNFMTKQGTLCNFRESSPQVVRYAKQNPEHACYRDGIFYPRCADYDNPEVRKYHDLLYHSKND